MRILVPAMAALLMGCATTAPPAQPRFLPGPLEELAIAPGPRPGPAVHPGDSAVTAEGPVVVGPRGHALNVASSLHRVFQALGIPSEVRCEPASEAHRRQIRIRFPAGLSESQQEDVRVLLGLIRREVATL